MVSVGIITIGDEILIGQIVDTNSAWIGGKLNDMGYRVHSVVSISDNKSEIIRALNYALETNDITLVTGGIGPTKDDITKRTLAEMFDCELVKNEECYDAVRKLCERRGLIFNELNQLQGYVPACCKAIVNDNGTAPAMLFERNGNMLISMPGVPFEMKELCTNKIFPMLVERFGVSKNIHVTKTVYGLPESTLAITIADWEDSLPKDMHLAYLPTPQRVRLRISVYGGVSSREDVEKEFIKLRDIIPQYFIGDENMSVEASTAEILLEKGESLAIAESCTGGAIANRFTIMAGASKYFTGGVIAYSNSVKIDILGVSEDSINEHGAVSEAVVREMAEGVRNKMDTTYGIATTGIAGPDGGSSEKPLGTVWFALATPSETITVKKVFSTLREQNIDYASSYAISLLRNYLINK